MGEVENSLGKDDCPEAEQVACVSIGRRHPEVNVEMTLKDK